MQKLQKSAQFQLCLTFPGQPCRSRGKGVDPNVLCGVIDRHDLGELDQRAFGRTIGGASRAIKTTSHPIYASTESSSNRGEAFQESSQHIARSARPTCGSFAAKQTASQSSNVGDTVSCGVDLVSYFFDCYGGERSVRFRIAGVLRPTCRSHKRYHRSNSVAHLGQSFGQAWKWPISLREE